MFIGAYRQDSTGAASLLVNLGLNTRCSALSLLTVTPIPTLYVDGIILFGRRLFREKPPSQLKPSLDTMPRPETRNLTALSIKVSTAPIQVPRSSDLL